MMSAADGAIRVADNDPRLAACPPGECKLIDRTFYVRESDWLQFLRLVAAKVGGEEVADGFWKAVTH